MLDTNVIVSSTIVPNGKAARIMKHLEGGRFTLLTSEAILAECWRVLGKPHLTKRHKRNEAGIEEVVVAVRGLATVVTPEVTLDVVPRDASDNRILECAQAGEADYIVTGDHDLQDLGSFAGIQILTPTAFLLLLEQEEPRNGA
ncbi:MAG TPA: putative toxin-antitoxin system toxin component, PIN family [Chloroflexia bacterium]|nr:putative toxin-antitoxin system toxin component, PIN family [Chloroflexia bacterium]